jgi:hypothetical protein
MSFGFERQKRVFKNDSAELIAFLVEEDLETPVPLTEISAVNFTIFKPSDPSNTPTINAQPGTITGDGRGEFIVSYITIDEPGEYKGVAQFVLSDGRRKSVPVDFDVVDPFEVTGTGPSDGSIDLAWIKLEDCFDSEIGGPWLRDMTMARFDKSKMKRLIPDVLLEINTYQPQTSYTEATYPYLVDDGLALFAQGLLAGSIRHLMRSYTEQPEFQNSPAGWLSRNHYSQAWKNIYDIENERWIKWLAMSKIRIYNLGSPRLLVGSKAGRLLPAPMRGRSAARGYY